MALYKCFTYLLTNINNNGRNDIINNSGNLPPGECARKHEFFGDIESKKKQR